MYNADNTTRRNKEAEPNDPASFLIFLVVIYFLGSTIFQVPFPLEIAWNVPFAADLIFLLVYSMLP